MVIGRLVSKIAFCFTISCSLLLATAAINPSFSSNLSIIPLNSRKAVFSILKNLPLEKEVVSFFKLPPSISNSFEISNGTLITLRLSLTKFKYSCSVINLMEWRNGSSRFEKICKKLSAILSIFWLLKTLELILFCERIYPRRKSIILRANSCSKRGSSRAR